MASKSVCLILRDVIFRKSRSCICGKRYLSTSNVQESAKAVSFSKRTHTCGELSRSNVGEDVVLCGWLQYQRMGSFLVLRDWKGLVQAVISEDQKAKIVTDVTKLPQECVVKVEGTVRERPQGQENKKMDTGEIEVLVKNLQVLNSCQQNLPFEVKQFHEVKESLRMKYRYLDIRQPVMQRNLRLRSSVIMNMREFLINQHGFVDVETPTLFRRTPGGAKEFIVPSRMPGRFYSLPQSPQQFKQLLMVGGIDRYFQIARCYRDEGAKPDRQPEFTQVDIEMSFVDQEGVKSMVEGLLEHSWPAELGKLSLSFPRLSYEEVMSRFGVDKPDTRFGMELCDISKHLQSYPVPAIQEAVHSDSGSVQALCVPQASKYFSNKEVDSIITTSKENLSKGNVYSVKIKDDGIWQGGVAKTIDDEAMKCVSNHIAAQPGDIVVMTTGDNHQPHSTLGHLRLKFAEALESKGIKVRKEDVYNFLWVEDFPLFLPKEDGTEGVESAHHPFTAPHPDDEHLLFTHPEQARSQHYDLVLNGAEIGGGSIRIHNSRLQTHVLQNVLKEDSSQLTHLLEALDSGCPPHGGIALGLDRLMSIICNTDSIRDVIAFPKSHDGKDPMSGAPSEVAKEDLDLYNIKVKT